VLTFEFGLGASRCAYDATTHALVGATEDTDSSEFCDGGSSGRGAGRLPPASCLPMGAVLTRTCPPLSSTAGADAGG